MNDFRITVPTLKVLRLLLDNVRTSYSGAEITKRTKVGPGTLYPLLARLETHGWLSSAWEDVDPSEVGRPRKRLYRLTGVGQRSALNTLSEFQEGKPAWI